MIDQTTIIFILTTIGAFIWALLTRWNLLDAVDFGNEKINAIVQAARDQAIASDTYMRITADGIITVDEQEEHRKAAADANVSLLYAIEQITGKPIYNRTEVPLPVPVGGKRAGTEPTPEQPAPEGAA
mgnify:CR=1 FL=1